MISKSNVSQWTAALLCVFTLGFSHNAGSENQVLCAGFLPENDMKIPVGMFTTGGITEKEFNDVLDRIEKIYKDDVTKLGDKLSISRQWTNDTVNASAMRNGNTQLLNMYGGLARHPSIGIEGFALVACHEFGHHNGGAPKISGWGNNWATNEGGADYFATLKCLRRFFAEDDNGAILKDQELDPVASAACDALYPQETDRLICLRISMSGQQVANLFQAMRKEPTPPNFGTPDRSIVNRMDDNHPGTQCRLDTYFAGANCVVPESDPVDKTDYRKGACYEGHDQVGFRPRCWFFPKN